jgi:TetR/AcrR family transcriptional repressor of nem operon
MLRRMPRPRSFNEDRVVAAAKDLFWERGYQRTSVADLEKATSLSRSSLYTAFGNKRNLFAGSLRVYLATFVDPRLRPLERDGAGAAEIVEYFQEVAEVFADPAGQRGCLMINTIGECSETDPGLREEGGRFLERVRAAFANALSRSVRGGVMTPQEAAERAALLEGAMVGAWLTVRADPPAARAVCTSAISQVESWGGL